MLRYWLNIGKAASSSARETLGVGHPKGWIISIAVWLLATFLTYAFRGKPEDVMDGTIIALCGFAAIGIMFFVLMAVQFVTLPPALDAQANARIRQLEKPQTARQPVGPVRLRMIRMADDIADVVESASLDRPDDFYGARDAARRFLAGKLTPDWIECFDASFHAADGRNIDPLYWLERLEEWIRGCASEIDDDSLLPGETAATQS